MWAWRGRFNHSKARGPVRRPGARAMSRGERSGPRAGGGARSDSDSTPALGRPDRAKGKHAGGATHHAAAAIAPSLADWHLPRARTADRFREQGRPSCGVWRCRGRRGRPAERQPATGRQARPGGTTKSWWSTQRRARGWGLFRFCDLRAGEPMHGSSLSIAGGVRWLLLVLWFDDARGA